MWQRRWLRWAFFFGLWTLIGFVFASQLRFFGGRTNQGMSWSDVLLYEVPRWCLWAPISLIVLRLAQRFRIEREQLIRGLLIHASFSLLVSFFHLTVVTMVTLVLDVVWYEWPLAEIFSGLADKFLPLAIHRFQLYFFIDFHVGALVYCAILILYHAFEYYRRASRLEAQLAQAQVRALKMQLHPHFLFNTLNSISALLHKDIEAADEMIGGLGEFLRLTLESSGAQEARLEEELEFVRCYLEIEQVRFQQRLTTHFEIEPQVLDAQVPNLILQPIIENAIRYAIAPRPSPGLIEIRARRRDGTLILQVIDDGPGLPAREGDGNCFKEGIGLTNTRARLEYLYGRDHHFELANAPGGGLQVTLEIPFKKAVIARPEGQAV